MKLLLVEDEIELSQSIVKYFGSIDFTCDCSDDFMTGFDKIFQNEYSCIILDINLPHGSGLTLLKELKKKKFSAGVIIISANSSIDDKVNALNLGADDYLAKPFHLAELKARVHAIVRRNLFDGKNIITLDKLTLDTDDRTLKTESHTIDLTKKEYELLLYFIGNKNKVVTKEAIVEYLWGYEADYLNNYDFVYTHIKNIRKKLMEAGCPDYIKAVYGMGYKFSHLQ